MIVVAGATGFVGRQLVRALAERGEAVRGGARDPAGAARREPGIAWAQLDVDREEGLDAALAGARALVYLVHQMGTHGPGLQQREEASATRVLRAAERAGVRRIVYLGGPSPEGVASEHLRARLRTGEILRSGRVSAIELRAAMIVGAGSESWTICRDLALRLPVMVLPRWLSSRSQPIGVDDVVAALAHAVDDPLEGSAWFDLPGPETVAARDMLLRVAAQVGVRPVMVPVPVLTPALSAWWLRLVTRADAHIARKLVVGLGSDLVAPTEGYWARMPGHRRLDLDEAVRRALSDEAGKLPRRARAWEAVVRRVGPKARRQ